MSRSQNGWPANASASSIIVRNVPFAGGVTFPGGIAHHDGAEIVLGYVFEQFHKRVEKLRPGWCWGFYFRANRNDPNSLSNHSSGTAGDCNAPLHPNGVSKYVNFSQKQIDEIHKILAEVEGVVRWGGDYTRTVDAMHFELNASMEAVRKVAAKIREGRIVPGKPSIRARLQLAPSKSKARKAVRFATGADIVNVHAISRDKVRNDDAADVQRVLNAWYPHGAVRVDGVWGQESYERLQYAAAQMGIIGPVSNVAVRTRVLRKLGLKVVNPLAKPAAS